MSYYPGSRYRMDTDALNRRCGRTHPDEKYGCNLLRNHEGSHQNTFLNKEWSNNGLQRCNSVGRGRGCLLDEDHDGQHQNGKVFWE